MTKAKREEIKELAFLQTAFQRLFFLKGEVLKINVEIATHDRQATSWENMDDEERVRDFTEKVLKIEYLRSLSEAYKKEAEGIEKILSE